MKKMTATRAESAFGVRQPTGRRRVFPGGAHRRTCNCENNDVYAVAKGTLTARAYKFRMVAPLGIGANLFLVFRVVLSHKWVTLLPGKLSAT